MRPAILALVLLAGCPPRTDVKLEDPSETDADADADADTDTDSGCARVTLYSDGDGDGYGNPNFPIETCEGADGYVADATDCNDGNANVHPGALEVCGDFDDDDCDGWAVTSTNA
jgi:hypothetical protein